MQIEKNAVAGTLESSDALVTVEPAEQGIELEISSSVMNQYGRQIRQTVLVARELRKVIGHDPKKIFIEMARGKEKKPERKPERKQTLLACYETFWDEAGALYETLMQTDNQRLRQDKIYLYYTQMGRCMYSGERIDLEELLRSESLYDIEIGRAHV